MKRVHFIEIEDQVWCPKNIRDGVTDFLQHIVYTFRLYKPISMRLATALDSSGQKHLVDLCSGGAGPWLSLLDDLKKQFSENGKITVTLTDLYPNLAAFQSAKNQYPQQIDFSSASINALQVPAKLPGFRTLFSSFHLKVVLDFYQYHLLML